MSIHMCIHMSIHMCIHMCMDMCMHISTHVSIKHVHTNVYQYVYTHVYRRLKRKGLLVTADGVPDDEYRRAGTNNYITNIKSSSRQQPAASSHSGTNPLRSHQPSHQRISYDDMTLSRTGQPPPPSLEGIPSAAYLAWHISFLRRRIRATRQRDGSS